MLLQSNVELMQAIMTTRGNVGEGLVGKDQVGLAELVASGGLTGRHNQQLAVTPVGELAATAGEGNFNLGLLGYIARSREGDPAPER